MLTEQEKQIIDAGKSSGKSQQEIMGALARFRQQNGVQPQAPVAPKKPGVVEDTVGDFLDIGQDAIDEFGQGGKNIVDKITAPNDPNVGIVENVARKAVGVGSEIYKRGGRFIGKTYMNLAKMFLPQSFEDKLKEVGTGTVEEFKKYNKEFLEENKDDPGVQKFMEIVGKYKTDPKFKEQVDNAGGFVEGVLEILGTKKITPKTDVGSALKNVRTLEPEFNVPYFKAAEDSVADALEKIKTYKNAPNEVPEGGAPKNVPEVDVPPEVKNEFRQELINNISVNVTNKTDQTAIIERLDKLIEQGEFQKAADEARAAAKKTGGTPISQKVIDTAISLGQKTAQKYRDLVDGATERISQNLDRQALTKNAGKEVPEVEANIAQMYINAVSPGVKGKKQTVEGFVQNKDQAVAAIKNITTNKKDLKFRDIETNGYIEGQLPTNLWEFGGAITAQKAAVYKKVLESIGEAADKPVDTTRIIDAMDEIVNDPVYAGFPQIKNRAEDAFKQYAMNDYTPAQLERLIQLENDRLQAFYRGNGTQADAVVSAIIVNNLRDMLDEAVEAAGGEAVRGLKKEYGALKSIERDVVHRGIHNAQAREAGMVDMSSIRSIGDFAQGMTGDVSALQRSAAEIAGQSFIKALNDRDALIRRMFLVADQTYNGL